MFKKLCNHVSTYNTCYIKASRNFANLNTFKRRDTYNGKETDRDDILPRIITNSKIQSPHDWKGVREEILSISRRATTENIDATALNFCISHKRFDLAQTYIKFLKNENIKLNLATMGKFFRLHHELYYSKLVKAKDDEDILTMYQELNKTYDVLDSITCENIITGLSVTKSWKECIKLLEDIKISSVPSTTAYSAVASAMFRHNENDLAWKLINEMLENNREPLDEVYFSFLRQIETKTPLDEAIGKLETLFDFFSYLDIKCNVRVATKISEMAELIGLSSRFTYVSSRGVCRNCNKKLQKMDLTAEEFDELKKAFFKKVIVGKNVFIKTTPEELQRFKDFTDKMGHFDVVVDGLNVAYSAGVKQGLQIQSMLLASVVKHFCRQEKKVLILGRQHMNRWATRHWRYVKENATVFLTENLSHDDPYILYCALHSGLNTIVITRDLMRGHLFLLKDVHHKKLFNRWFTQSHQRLLRGEPERATFKTPLPYMLAAQKDKNVWHIPYEDETEKQSQYKNYKWICLKL